MLLKKLSTLDFYAHVLFFEGLHRYISIENETLSALLSYIFFTFTNSGNLSILGHNIYSYYLIVSLLTQFFELLKFEFKGFSLLTLIPRLMKSLALQSLISTLVYRLVFSFLSRIAKLISKYWNNLSRLIFSVPFSKISNPWWITLKSGAKLRLTISMNGKNEVSFMSCSL